MIAWLKEFSEIQVQYSCRLPHPCISTTSSGTLFGVWTGVAAFRTVLRSDGTPSEGASGPQKGRATTASLSAGQFLPEMLPRKGVARSGFQIHFELGGTIIVLKLDRYDNLPGCETGGVWGSPSVMIPKTLFQN